MVTFCYHLLFLTICQFVMWKNDRFFEQRKKAFTPKIAAALLKNGKAKVKGLELTGFLSYRQIDATLSADGGGIKTILQTKQSLQHDFFLIA